MLGFRAFLPVTNSGDKKRTSSYANLFDHLNGLRLGATSIALAEEKPEKEQMSPSLESKEARRAFYASIPKVDSGYLADDDVMLEQFSVPGKSRR